LGGSAGTTYDAFKLISDGQKYGARVALFVRKINLSEHPLTFIEMLRRIVDHQITAEEAVKAYHDALKKLGIKPLREFADDKELTGNDDALSIKEMRSFVCYEHNQIRNQSD
jgi:hypothetical protein